MDWDPDGVVGSWSTTNNPGVLPGDGALLLIARVTVSADACSLGGQCFVVDDRLNNCPLCHPPPPFYIHDIPNAFRELECLGNITWDGVVDTADLGRMIRAFGTGWGDAEFNPRADLARDGVVDTADLGLLISAFGKGWGDAGYDIDADLNLDGAVDTADHGALIIAYADGSSSDEGALSFIGNTVGYSGYLYDEIAGLSLARYRWYSAELGRWMSR